MTKLENQHAKHAVYINDWIKFRDTYSFDCINSWGEGMDERPQLKGRDLFDVYYVSLIKGKKVKVW